MLGTSESPPNAIITVNRYHHLAFEGRTLSLERLSNVIRAHTGAKWHTGVSSSKAHILSWTLHGGEKARLIPYIIVGGI